MNHRPNASRSTGVRRAVAVGLLGLAVAFSGVSRAEPLTSIAAVVNEQIITAHDLEERVDLIIGISSLPDEDPEVRQRLRPQILRTLIDEKLQMQEAKRLNVTVAAGEMQEAISQIEQQNDLPVGGLAEFLRGRNLQLETLLDQIRANIAWSKVIRRQIRPQVEVGDEEVDEYLERLRQRGNATEYMVSEIFLPIEPGTDPQSTMQNAQRIVQEVRSGAPFAALATQFSRASTAANGGDLGVVREEQLEPRLEAALNRLSPGEVSEPIPVEGGVYILQLRDRRTTAAPRPEDATVALRRIFLPLPATATPDEIESQGDLARTVSETVQGCEDMDRLGREIGAAQPVDLGTVRVGDMPADLRASLTDLDIGKASPPVRLPDGFIVLMVCGRSESMAGLPPREEIARLLGTQRIETMARRYMRDLRRVAFVDVRV